MPSVWESPVPMEEGLAEALFMFLYHAKYHCNYLFRSINDPVTELEKEDVNPGDENAPIRRNFLVIWWIYIQGEWERHKKLARKLDKERKQSPNKDTYSIAFWNPLFFNMPFPVIEGQPQGKMVLDKLRSVSEGLSTADYLKAVGDLRRYVGFKAYMPITKEK